MPLVEIMDIKNILNKLVEQQDLTTEEVQEFIDLCAQGGVTSTQIAAVLIALRMKGETNEEIEGLIAGMRSHMVEIQKSGFKIQNIIDTCGTGGDKSNSFNISTTVALVAAGAGVVVAKHGNRAASSKCGSADVLEQLGVKITLTPDQAEAILTKVGIVFLFAPLYHPVMKYIAPVRKELGIRTVFNFLGPFLNPMKVKRQIIGVPDKKIAQKLAQVARHLDYEHLLLVSSDDGLDEISIFAETLVLEVKKNTIRSFTLRPSELGFKTDSKDTIVGGDAVQNAEIVHSILSGEKGAKRDIVILNAAAALYVAGKAKTISDGIPLAQQSIDSGAAYNVLKKIEGGDTIICIRC